MFDDANAADLNVEIQVLIFKVVTEVMKRTIYNRKDGFTFAEIDLYCHQLLEAQTIRKEVLEPFWQILKSQMQEPGFFLQSYKPYEHCEVECLAFNPMFDPAYKTYGPNRPWPELDSQFFDGLFQLTLDSVRLRNSAALQAFVTNPLMQLTPTPLELLQQLPPLTTYLSIPVYTAQPLQTQFLPNTSGSFPRVVPPSENFSTSPRGDIGEPSFTSWRYHMYQGPRGKQAKPLPQELSGPILESNQHPVSPTRPRKRNHRVTPGNHSVDAQYKQIHNTQTFFLPNRNPMKSVADNEDLIELMASGTTTSPELTNSQRSLPMEVTLVDFAEIPPLTLQD